MKRFFRLFSTLPLFAAAGWIAPGCASDDGPCTNGSACGGGGTTSSDGGGGAQAGGAGGASGNAGAGGAAPASCVPWENDPGVPLPASCGVFVGSSGGEGENGSTANPYRTLASALTGAPAGSVFYVCNELFEENVTIPAGVTLYGGIDCLNGWTYEGDGQSHLVGAADAVTARISSGEDSTAIYDFAIQAPDATQAGSSSIAVWIDGGDVTFERVDVTAGNGADGVDGGTPNNAIGPSNSNHPDIRGKAPSGITYAVCSNAGINHNPGGETVNPFCPESVGGLGGFGSVPPEGFSAVGGIAGEIDGGSGGATSGHGTACFVVGGAQPRGGSGADGTEGMHGTGANGLGTLRPDGWSGADGTDAARGTTGRGGGAGGRTSGTCGAGGAGGGAGGCGGFGGTAGTSAGSSIAVVVVEGTLTTALGTFTSGDGGEGGAGGIGQTGGVGGDGGAATNGGCGGGQGGDGGNGGRGGGGLGGHAVIAAHGPNATVTLGEASTTAFGAAGLGGAGADTASTGASGAAQVLLMIPTSP